MTSFSQRDYRIIEMTRDGLAPADIHDALKGSKAVISLVIHKARREGLLPPSKRGVRRDQMMRVPSLTWDAFGAVAAERGVKPEELMREVLKTIAKDDLFSAILDK